MDFRSRAPNATEDVRRSKRLSFAREELAAKRSRSVAQCETSVEGCPDADPGPSSKLVRYPFYWDHTEIESHNRECAFQVLDVSPALL